MMPLKIAVIGPGLMGKKHIDLIKSNADCILASLVAPDQPAHQEFARSLNVPLYHSVDSLLNSTPDIDGAIISSPNTFHAEQATSFIKAGIPILIEKPICHTVDLAEKLVNLTQQNSAKVLIGHHRAHSPILSTARDLIKEGRLGRLVGIMGSALFFKPKEYFEAAPWRSVIGGGPILINLIHEIGNLRSLCGEISAVQAISSSSIRNLLVEDTVVINFQFVNGALGTFFLSDTAAAARSWEHTSQENKSYPYCPGQECYLVTGTQGSLSVPTMRINYYESEESSSWWLPFKDETIQFSSRDPLECQLINFINMIRGTEEALVSAYDGLQNLQITEAISKSVMSKKLVYIK